MSATCSYPDKVFGRRLWGVFFSDSRATANFLFKNSHLVTIATGGRSGVNFNGIGATFMFLYLILAIFVLKFRNSEAF